jgi:DNA-binding MarR family transcriptional regulator
MLQRQEYPGLLIAVARRRIKQAVLARATPHGLSTQQFWVVIHLHERAGLSQRELATRMDIDPPTASRVLGALLRRRLVRAEEDPADRRRSRLHLTAAGVALARTLAAPAAEIRRGVVAGMTAPEVDALRGGLQKVIDNMGRLSAGSLGEGA